MPQLDLGRLRFAYQGAYNGSTVYERNDVVTYQNDVYVYTSATSSSGNVPTDVTRWAKMVEGPVPQLLTDAGKVLTTDGTSTSWTDTLTLDTLTVETSLTSETSFTSEGPTYIGTGASAFETAAGLTDAALVVDIEGGENSFAQIAFHNSEPTSSTDIIAYASNGNDSNGWVGLGITGDKFDDSTYGITGQGDAYVFAQSTAAGTIKSVTSKTLVSDVATLTATSHGFQVGQRVVVSGVDSTFNGAHTITAVTTNTFSYAKVAVGVSPTAVSPAGSAKIQSAGNLVIATGDAGTDNAIIFAAGGYASGNTQMTIVPDDRVHVEIATSSTSPITGALTVAGGVGVTGNINVSGDILAGTDLLTNNSLYVGSGAKAFETSATLTDAAVVAKITGGASSFAQIAFTNATSSSSTDIIAYMDNGNDSEGWIGMGIAGSTFDDTTYGITGPGDGYIFHETKAGATGPEYTGNLVLATGGNGSENKIIFAAGGFSSGTTQMEITPGVNVHVEIPTPSTSPTTGAFTVVGGVGIQGDMNIQGNVAIQGTITFGGGGTTVNTANLTVTDPFVFVGNGNQADIVDLAFIGEYATTVSAITRSVNNKALSANVATITTTAAHTYQVGDVVTITGVDATFNGTYSIVAVPTTTTFTYAKTAGNVSSTAVSPTGTAVVNARRKFAGVARDASDGVIKFFKDATTKPTTTINFSEAGLAYADIQINSLSAATATIGNVSNTELQYLDGVTSAIQNQLDSKAPLLQTTTSPTFTTNNYTLVLTDRDKITLASNGATAGTITVPLNSTAAFPLGSVLTVVQTGTGQLTLTPETVGVTINSHLSKRKLSGQYASAQIIKTGTDTWLAIGNLAL